jgi:glycosyltransferase involved in cell wall biosynthesis
MRILFVNSYGFLPQAVGGIEVSVLDLCRSLQAHGHDVAVLCSLLDGDALWLWNRVKKQLLRRPFPMDRHMGVRVYRGWLPVRGIDDIARRERPDAIVVQGGAINSYEIAAESVRLGYATFYYAHDVGVLRAGTPLPDMSGVRWIANSPFTAQVLKQHLGVASDIIPPIFHAEKYRVERAGDCVTMVNPRLEKGGDCAVRVAELCPELPFLFVEAWASQHPDVLKLKAQASRLPNVTWLRAQPDMRQIYARTRLLFTPSRCEETWGRVITEAQFSGIPTLASDIGALPYTSGPGGALLPADASPEDWAQLIRNIYTDDAEYGRLSANALQYSQRDELQVENVVKAFAGLVQGAKRK